VSAAALTVVVVYPDLLGTYGDGGNGLVLARRAAWRGVEVELVEADSDGPLPQADLYCLGGGEDGPQVRAADALSADGRLSKAVEAGAAVLAVCAGYQIVGRSFPDGSGQPRPGLGLLDVTTAKSTGRRAVGEVLAEPLAGGPPGGPLPIMTGFENHGGVTTLGPGARPLSRTVVGVGNGAGTEGAWSGRVVGTYLHGPVLARNPALADRLLAWVLGGPLDPLDDDEEGVLRAERLAAARPRGPVARLRRWGTH
jgi:CobQ-like glutamine amidotransferase family enzyme